jgi:hypothetical protein
MTNLDDADTDRKKSADLLELCENRQKIHIPFFCDFLISNIKLLSALLALILNNSQLYYK